MTISWLSFGVGAAVMLVVVLMIVCRDAIGDLLPEWPVRVLWNTMPGPRLQWFVKIYPRGASWYGIGIRDWFIGVQRWRK